jgi:hypothetical protein
MTISPERAAQFEIMFSELIAREIEARLCDDLISAREIAMTVIDGVDPSLEATNPQFRHELLNATVPLVSFVIRTRYVRPVRLN